MTANTYSNKAKLQPAPQTAVLCAVEQETADKRSLQESIPENGYHAEVDLKMTLRAGRLTPAASVEVAHSTEMAPVLYAFSTSSRSSDVSPACAFAHSFN